VVAKGVLGSCLMYHGDDFGQEGNLFVLLHGIGFRGMLDRDGLLLWWCDIGQGHRTTAEVMVFHAHKELAVGADLLSLMPVCTCLAGVKASFAGDLE